MASCLPLVGSQAFGDEYKAIRRNAAGDPSIASATRLGDLYAVVVGVSKYANPKVPSLKFADKDARDVAEFLKSQDKLFRRIHVTLLLNEQATSAELKKHLVYEFRRAGKDDTVVLFLSGHGADDPKIPGEFFFITHDGDPNYLEATSVNLTEMKFMRRLDSRRAVLIADTCHSGGFSMHGVKTTDASLSRFINQFTESEGKVILTSCRPDEFSVQKSGMSNSVFTHYFLEALRGTADRNNDGVVTLQEAYEFVYEKAKDETAGVQHPQLSGRLVGSFPLSLSRIQPLSPSMTQPRPTNEVSPRDLDEARKLFSQAEKGDANAQFLLGLMYQQGSMGFAKDDQQATKWLKKAADKGHDGAKALLGLMPMAAVQRPTVSQELAKAQPRDRDDVNQELWHASNRGDFNVVRISLGKGADPNFIGPDGCTALMNATYKGNLDIVKALLEAGADPLVRSRSGNFTALDFAKSKGLRKVIHLLSRYQGQ